MIKITANTQLGLTQAAFDISIPILGKLIWKCPNLILRKTETSTETDLSDLFDFNDLISTETETDSAQFQFFDLKSAI